MRDDADNLGVTTSKASTSNREMATYTLAVMKQSWVYVMGEKQKLRKGESVQGAMPF